jgi:hypothetical protein
VIDKDEEEEQQNQEDEKYKHLYLETDDEVVDEKGWMTKRSNFIIKIYGNSCFYIGLKFIMGNNTSTEFKIHSVVFRKDNKNELFFKYYNANLRTPPPSDSNNWLYIQCVNIMSNDKSKSFKIGIVGGRKITGFKLVSRNVVKDFSGRRYRGKILSYNEKAAKFKPYHVKYEDGEEKDYTAKYK